jgi:hypothetical protein
MKWLYMWMYATLKWEGLFATIKSTNKLYKIRWLLITEEIFMISCYFFLSPFDFHEMTVYVDSEYICSWNSFRNLQKYKKTIQSNCIFNRHQLHFIDFFLPFDFHGMRQYGLLWPFYFWKPFHNYQKYKKTNQMNPMLIEN